MNRLRLPILGALLLCAHSFSAQAASSTTTSSATPTYEQVREQIEAKRAQLSGADSVGKATVPDVQDAPVQTDDAPNQEQQP